MRYATWVSSLLWFCHRSDAGGSLPYPHVEGIVKAPPADSPARYGGGLASGPAAVMWMDYAVRLVPSAGGVFTTLRRPKRPRARRGTGNHFIEVCLDVKGWVCCRL